MEMEKDLYWKMYAGLCARVSDAIDLLKEPKNTLYVSALLQKALDEAEELYLNGEEDSNDEETKALL